jgi:hypothetical protein
MHSEHSYHQGIFDKNHQKKNQKADTLLLPPNRQSLTQKTLLLVLGINFPHYMPTLSLLETQKDNPNRTNQKAHTRDNTGRKET